MKKNFGIGALLCVILSMAACKTRRPEPATLQLPAERTAFYTIEAIRDSVKQKTDFRLLKMQVVDTKVNFRTEEEKATNPWHLKIEIVNKTAPTITVYSEHPLFRRIDLFSESGEISSKFLSLPKGQFTLRVPYVEEYKKFIITETVGSKQADPIYLNHEK